MKTKPINGNASLMARQDLAPLFIRELDRLGPNAHPDSSALAMALLSDARRHRVSDLHFEPCADGTRVRFRIDGVLNDVVEVSVEQARLAGNQLKSIADLDPVTRFTCRDTRATVQVDGSSLDFRLALMPCHHGESLVVRLLDPKRLERSLAELGLSPQALAVLEDWLEDASGMFLAAGPTGSGKTTTIYALLHKLRFAGRSIISIEDPVEYQIDGITQVKIDELHHVDFAEAVKAVLRQDPDFLVLGEIRDALSAQGALNAAISGRVLLSTVHCRDAFGAITALRNWGLPDHEVAELLSVVVAQRLVRRLCPYCRRQTEPAAADSKWLDLMQLPAPESLWTAPGCEECHDLGYSGRTGVFKLWRLDGNDRDLIMNHASEHELRAENLRKKGEHRLHDAFAKVVDGMTSITEIRLAGGCL